MNDKEKELVSNVLNDFKNTLRTEGFTMTTENTDGFLMFHYKKSNLQVSFLHNEDISVVYSHNGSRSIYWTISGNMDAILIKFILTTKILEYAKITN